MLGARVAIAAVSLVATSLPVAANAAPEPRSSGAAETIARLQWAPCGDGFECATLAVPSDYANPTGGDVQIEVKRQPATNPDTRIGVLVVNYGGPGDPATETLELAADNVPAAVRDRFDLVAFDPRGSGSSQPVDCIDDDTFERAWADDPTPNGTDELPSFYDGTASEVDLVAECLAHHGDWLARVGTRNVARDLDRLRAALGERRVNYLGYSYGTVLGALYAQDFPDRIRTMVLDSAVDLSSDMTTQQRRNAEGFERALGEFLDDCAARTTCPFHSDGDPRAALLALRDRFEGGLRLSTPDGRGVGISEFYVAMLTALYSRAEWPFLAESLELADNRGNARRLQTLNDAYAGRRDDGTYSNFLEVLGVIRCDDDPEPLASFDDYRAQYETFSRDYPFFGAWFGSTPLGCDPRLPSPRPDEVVGDVRVEQAPPVLIVGATRDPATPYTGAKNLRRRIVGSRVLTVDDTRHGLYSSGNACVDDLVDQYLIARVLPPRRTRCAAA